ncbi:MAG: NYN domain-containing protein [Ottowia sp.]|nr:NYN domain-containing protein [Ottowia sp.]
MNDIDSDASTRRLAVLIDADNAPASMARELFEEIARYGIASVKRIYGDWSSPLLAGWRAVLLHHALVPVQQFAYTKGKNATDMQLTIDAMDMLHEGHLHGFCLVSSDSDFTPLAQRLRSGGLLVYGFGRQQTPEAFRQACDRFITLENLGSGDAVDKPQTAADKESAPPIASAPARKMDGATRTLLYKAIKDCAGEGEGWASMGAIATYIRQTNPGFDSRDYGYSKLSKMLRELRGVQFGTNQCRKIPYSNLMELLREAIDKFKADDGFADANHVGVFLKPRWNWESWGFESFDALLATVDGLQRLGERIRLSVPA